MRYHLTARMRAIYHTSLNGVIPVSQGWRRWPFGAAKAHWMFETERWPLSMPPLRRHERRGARQIPWRQRREHREHFSVQRQTDDGDRGGDLDESRETLETKQGSEVGGAVR
jgi:hypothetical protein